MAKAKSKKITLEEALVPVEEQPYKVPGNWCWVKLRVLLAEIKNGTTIKQDKSGEGYSVTRIESIQNQKIDSNRLGTIVDSNAIKETDWYQAGDIAMSHINSVDHVGKTAMITEDMLPLVHGMNLLRLRFYECCLPKYFQYFTQSYQYKDEILKRINMAVNQVSINQKQVGTLEFPLPPLAEQRRIVEQIEGLLSKLDEVKEKIECLLDSKKVRCNSVLNKAFTGKLTAKWRENNNIKFETWEYINFEKIIVEGPQNGMYKPKTSYGSGTKILRIDCFYDGKLEPLEKLKRLEITDEEKHTYLLSVNDIVVNRVNSMPYLGKSALIRKLPEQCVFESNMMRIKINIRKANPEYVIRYLNSSIGLQELRKNAKQAVNQASINQQDVKMVKIALPSLEEQNEIVKIITSISNKDEAILNKAEAVIEEIDLMKKSILAKAFRGELGTNISKEKNSIEVLKKLIEEESK